MKVRELIEILLDFPLDSDVCIEDGYGGGDYCDVISISHDSECDDMGYIMYSITTIHIKQVLNSDSDLFDWDFRGDWVTEDTLTVYDGLDEDFYEVDSYKIKFNKKSQKFERITE